MTGQNLIENRMEILFLYEAKDCNPNGDPLDENKPRTDPETGVATVTDVRIKRTVRDYLFQTKDLEILVRDTEDEQGYLKDGKGRCDDFLAEAGVAKTDTITEMVSKTRNTILDRCIDARLFGATLPVEFGGKKSSIRLTGPVQFSGFNRSLHRVSPQLIQGTAGFASKKNSTQKSFREDHILPYALISTYGIVNEVAAKTTKLSKNDVSLLLEGLWKGTESLISRSKIGHQPILLLAISYANGRRLGDLSSRISLTSQKDHLAIRSIDDYEINISQLLDGLSELKDEIKGLEIVQDSRLKLRAGDNEGDFTSLAVTNGLQSAPLVIG